MRGPAPAAETSAGRRSNWPGDHLLADRLSSLRDDEGIRLCFMHRSPKLFALFSHCLRCGRHRLPPDAHTGRGGSPLIFGLRVLALEQRLVRPRLPGSLEELHLDRVAIELCHASNEKVRFEFRE